MKTPLAVCIVVALAACTGDSTSFAPFPSPRSPSPTSPSTTVSRLTVSGLAHLVALEGYTLFCGPGASEGRWQLSCRARLRTIVADSPTGTMQQFQQGLGRIVAVRSAQLPGPGVSEPA